MDAWFHKNYNAAPIRRSQVPGLRFGMPIGAGEWVDLKEKGFKFLVALAAVLVFVLVFAWDYMPWNAAAPDETKNPEFQRLAAMDEAEMRELVWPTSAADIEADQPEFGRKALGDMISPKFELCGAGARISCVVDGDTFWYKGEKIRIADIDAPEVSNPECAREGELGKRATNRMIALLNAGPITMRSTNEEFDQYGRRLLVVTRSGRSLGAVLVREGLAERWGGPRINWCRR